jgi:dephospho-CoA kinase
VARAAFASDQDRAWLEGLVWPRVGERIAAWRAELADRRPPPRAAVFDQALLWALARRLL